MCNKLQGTEVLSDPAFGRKIAGGLLVEFEGGIRVVRSMGWISGLSLNSSDISIQLSMMLYRSGSIWNANESSGEICVSLNPAESVGLYICSNGAEYHFAPKTGNHFSIYEMSALYNPHIAGNMEGLKHYKDRAVRALCLATNTSN